MSHPLATFVVSSELGPQEAPSHCGRLGVTGVGQEAVEQSHIPAAEAFASKAVPRDERGKTELKETRANEALFPDSTSQETFDSVDELDASYFGDAVSKILHGDVVECLKGLIRLEVKVDCVVTSPPFYGQRDYGASDQIGLEDHPSKYVEKLVEVFELVREVLRDTGTLWVNVGDTYWSGKGQHRSQEKKQSARRFGFRPQDGKGDGTWARPKQLLLIPHRFAAAMQDAGWIVRNDNVWVKPNPIPDQVRDRCSTSHEYVFHFTKERWYYFDRPAVGIKSSTGRLLPPTDTWEVPPTRGNGSHKAAFSEDLVRIPILGGTPPNGIVLDPFCGSGTAMVFARRHGLRSIGIDIVEEYCQLSKEAVLETDPPAQ